MITFDVGSCPPHLHTLFDQRQQGIARNLDGHEQDDPRDVLLLNQVACFEARKRNHVQGCTVAPAGGLDKFHRRRSRLERKLIFCYFCSVNSLMRSPFMQNKREQTAAASNSLTKACCHMTQPESTSHRCNHSKEFR